MCAIASSSTWHRWKQPDTSRGARARALRAPAACWTGWPRSSAQSPNGLNGGEIHPVPPGPAGIPLSMGSRFSSIMPEWPLQPWKALTTEVAASSMNETASGMLDRTARRAIAAYSGGRVAGARLNGCFIARSIAAKFAPGHPLRSGRLSRHLGQSTSSACRTGVSSHPTTSHLLKESPIVDEQRSGHRREDLHVEAEPAIADMLLRDRAGQQPARQRQWAKPPGHDRIMQGLLLHLQAEQEGEGAEALGHAPRRGREV